MESHYIKSKKPISKLNSLLGFKIGTYYKFTGLLGKL